MRYGAGTHGNSPAEVDSAGFACGSVAAVFHPQHSCLLPCPRLTWYEIAPTSDVIRDRVLKADREGDSWECWAEPDLVSLFVAEMSLTLSRERGSPVLRVYRYQSDGQMQEPATGWPAKSSAGADCPTPEWILRRCDACRPHRRYPLVAPSTRSAEQMRQPTV